MNNQLKSIINACIIFGIFELFFFRHNLIYIALIVANLFIIKITLRQKKEWSYTILPTLLTSSILLFSILIANKILIQFLFVTSTFFIYWYFKAFYNLSSRISNSNTHYFINIIFYGNFLAFFFGTSLIYGLDIHLNITFIPLCIYFGSITSLSMLSILTTLKKIDKNKNEYTPLKQQESLFFILAALSISITELALVIAFLPFSYFTLGLLLSLCYYVIIGLVHHFLKSDLSKKTIRLYLSAGALGIFLLIITARWM